MTKLSIYFSYIFHYHRLVFIQFSSVKKLNIFSFSRRKQLSIEVFFHAVVQRHKFNRRNFRVSQTTSRDPTPGETFQSKTPYGGECLVVERGRTTETLQVWRRSPLSVTLPGDRALWELRFSGTHFHMVPFIQPAARFR